MTKMSNYHILFFLIFFIFIHKEAKSQTQRPRVIVTTDGEADDRASMVRFLLYANEFDIEGIINSSSQFHWQGGEGWNAFHPVSWVKDYIALYAKVHDNLLLHDPNYPSPEYLLSKWKVGNIDGIGEDEIRTEGAELIAQVLLDDSDSRPVWIQAWGGVNTISRGFKIIQEDHPEKMREVAAKARLFLIWEQDETYQDYIRPNWGQFNVPTIISDQFDCLAYIWSKVLPEKVKPYFEKDWMTAHILNGHGPLTDAYENNKGAFNAEGDTPAFLYNIPNGLRSMESPDFGGWAGRYVQVRNNVWMDPLPDSTFSYPEGQWGFSNSWSKIMENDTSKYRAERRTNYFKPIWRWLEHVQNDFAARADWCLKDYKNANHHPIINLGTPLDMKVKLREGITLDASATTDPDSDQLKYKWWHYNEADSYEGASLQDVNSAKINFHVPKDAQIGDTIHLICEVTDSGKPSLTSYKRVIITVD